MKAFILNSGMGTRMGNYTSEAPKCLVELSDGETILSRQLRMIESIGIQEVVMTTGYLPELLKEYIQALNLSVNVKLVNNPQYRETNYIYSMYLAREFVHDDILLLHGDLVFEAEALNRILENPNSGMAVSSTMELPEKDFKAVIRDGSIASVGIEFFQDALAAQPLYVLKQRDWEVWLDKIVEFCENGQVNCYAENALNTVTDNIRIEPVDVKELLCQEIDKEEDLLEIRKRIMR